ncbi:hypothetical protein LSAT2_019611 [Lamellibrachia satsuma]|nr:hypothetical protein LSAT2_019611 [Lamellibrachia satsuma]
MNKVGSLKVDGEQRPKLVQSLPDGTVVSSTDTLPTPPDGGWGWMVVFSTFIVHVIVCGIPNSFGIFLIAFIEQFDAGRGPIVSTLTNKYGCRVVSNAGSILAAFGFVISVFAPNLYYLYFSFGIVSGECCVFSFTCLYVLGVSKLNAAFLISVIGVSDTIARGFFGLLAGIECVNPLYLRSTALTLCGISTFLSIFCFNYEMFVVYAVFFGGCSGVSVCLTPVVLVNLLGTEQFTNAFGLLILFEGVATIVGPPMAGWLYDVTHSYDLPFAIVGAVTTCSGLILYSIPCVQRLRQRRRRRRLEQDNVSTEHGLSLSVRDA